MIDRLKEIMSTVFDVEVTEITDDAVAGDLEKWDSLHHMNLIAALEEEFEVEFDEEDILAMMSLKLIVLTLKEKLGA